MAKKRKFYSETFSISPNSSSKFVIFYEPKSESKWQENTYGIDLKDLGEVDALKFDIEIWLENESGEIIAKNIRKDFWLLLESLMGKKYFKEDFNNVMSF